MSNNDQPSLAEALQRASSMASWGGTSVPSRQLRLSPPPYTNDPKTVARNRIDAVNHRAKILRTLDV